MKSSAKLKIECLKQTNAFYLNQTDVTPYLTLPSPKGNTISIKYFDFTVDLYIKFLIAKCSALYNMPEKKKNNRNNKWKVKLPL